MDIRVFKDILENFHEGIVSFCIDNPSVYLALFDLHGQLLFASDVMSEYFDDNPWQCILNPGIERILSLDRKDDALYKGIITIGEPSGLKMTSIYGAIFLNKNVLLIIGCQNSEELVHQNKYMSILNQQVNNLQRQLIKEKVNLETALNDLNKANNQLKEVNYTKDRLFSIIAHDLKSPFNSILGFSELLKEEYSTLDKDEFIEILDVMNSSSRNTLALLENLLDWTKSQTGKLKFEPKMFDINEVINSVITGLETSAKLKDKSLIHHFSDINDIFADKKMVETVLRNLISNSIKFTQKYGRIEVKVETDADNWLFSVKDNGIGMSTDVKSKLFRNDTVVTTTGTSSERGSGLGLILCKEFVELHNGIIWVESQEKIGSNFLFKIPFPSN